MKLYPLTADLWKMDGGVAFGVVPKSLWSRNLQADENNMIPIVTRCLLVETGKRLILIDTGMGHKRTEKYYQVRYRDAETDLIRSLQLAGFKPEQITDIVFTHLHDDHVGGATFRNENGEIEEVFHNAAYYCSKAQWEWAIHPNKREGASYFEDNLQPLFLSGKLRFIDSEGEWIPGINMKIFNGHTMGQLIPLIEYAATTVVFSGDFIPTLFNIPLPFVPAVDIFPLLSMKEKAEFLQEAARENWVLLFEHDYFNECCTLKETEKGFAAHESFTLSSILS